MKLTAGGGRPQLIAGVGPTCPTLVCSEQARCYLGSMAGRAIRIFLVDGTTTGLRIAELGLSTVQGVFCPRGSLEALSSREESRRTGVYVLLGEDPSTPGRPALYVGEGDDVMKRLLAHDRDPEKDFWTRVAFFVSKDRNLTKAHVRFVEARLIELAMFARRATVLNRAAPNGGLLPEADTAEMEEFLSQVRLLLATSGTTAFDAPAPATKPIEDGPSSQRSAIFSMSGDGYAARCRVADGEFVVLSGSTARESEAQSLSNSSRALRRELTMSEVLVRADGRLCFQQDYSFGSASGSAQLICAASVNGRIVWKRDDGMTLKDWQEERFARIDDGLDSE